MPDPPSPASADPTVSGPARALPWLCGGVAAWCGFALLIGTGTLLKLRAHPHPWLSGGHVPPIFYDALAEWMGKALAAYAGAGLLLAAAALPALAMGAGGRPFRRGLGLGLAMALWLHGILYLMVPIGLQSLPGLCYLPIGLSLAGFLGGGAVLGWRSLAPVPARGRRKVLLPMLAFLALLPCLPHDLFRWETGPALPAAEPRLFLVSLDALRRDTFEREQPPWKRSPGVQTITVFPSTRLAWETILGADPDRTFTTTTVPPLWEALHPGHLTLLAQARAADLRTAFAINDSLSPCYGLQPTLFNTVLEPPGGWKYWLSYGEGTCWPLYSWLQNLASPIETSNPWNESSAWLRDLDRLLRGHHWVSSHSCLLHPPMRLTLEEIQRFDPWRWLLHAPRAYVSYESYKEQEDDRLHWQESWRSDGKLQYEVRAARLLKELAPRLDGWARRYPALSGLLMADHGEGFPVYLRNGATPVTHGTGIHGFGLDALSVAIPVHGFGTTRDRLAEGDTWSLLDLRDSIRTWLKDRQPLTLQGNPKGWLVQMRTTVPTHLRKDPGPADHSQGLRPEEIAMNVQLLASGNWYQPALVAPGSEALPVSSALVTGSGMVLINPLEGGTYFRQESRAGPTPPGRVITRAEYAREIEAFPGRRAVTAALR